MSNNHIAKNALLFLPAKVLEGILLMLATALYSAIFTTDAVGIFRYVNSTVLLSYLVLFGFIANATTRYVLEETAHDSGRRMFSTIGIIYVSIFSAACVVSLGLYAYTSDFVYVLGVFMFASYALFQILNGALVQLSKIKSSIILSISSASLKLVVAYMLVFRSAAASESPYPAIIANIVADLFCGVLAVYTLGIHKVFSFNSFSRKLYRKFLNFGIPLMGVSINVGLLNIVDTYLVGFFHGNEAVAVYGQNYSISSSIFTMINIAIMRGVYPALIKNFKKDGLKTTLPALNSGVRLYMLVAFPAAAGLSAVSLSLCRIMFLVPEYHKGSPVISLTAAAMIFMGLTEYANKAYELHSDTKPVFLNSLIAAVIKISLSSWLLYNFSYISSAVGTLVAFISYFCVTALRVKSKFLFHVKALSVIRILFASLVCFVCARAATLLPVSNILSLILAVIFGGLSYTLCLILTREVKEEISILKNIRQPRGL